MNLTAGDRQKILDSIASSGIQQSKVRILCPAKILEPGQAESAFGPQCLVLMEHCLLTFNMTFTGSELRSKIHCFDMKAVDVVRQNRIRILWKDSEIEIACPSYDKLLGAFFLMHRFCSPVLPPGRRCNLNLKDFHPGPLPFPTPIQRFHIGYHAFCSYFSRAFAGPTRLIVAFCRCLRIISMRSLLTQIFLLILVTFRP
jgi:hypothetical protein